MPASRRKPGVDQSPHAIGERHIDAGRNTQAARRSAAAADLGDVVNVAQGFTQRIEAGTRSRQH